MKAAGMPRKRSALALSHATGGGAPTMMSRRSLKRKRFDLITYISQCVSPSVANEA